MSFIGENLMILRTIFLFSHWKEEILKFWNIFLEAELTSWLAIMDFPPPRPRPQKERMYTEEINFRILT